MMKKIQLSLILPTINEEENLKILIPDLINLFSSKNEVEYEIIVVDDGSTDNTVELLSKMNTKNNKVKIISRTGKPSLPDSIYEGIARAKYEYVLWMDADGSMPVYDVKRLIEEQLKNPDSVVIGSRFVEGGGYKGTSKDIKKSLKIRNFRDKSRKNSPLLKSSDGIIVNTGKLRNITGMVNKMSEILERKIKSKYGS